MSGTVNTQYYVFFVCIECVTLSLLKWHWCFPQMHLREHRLCNLHNMAKLCEGGKFMSAEFYLTLYESKHLCTSIAYILSCLNVGM